MHAIGNLPDKEPLAWSLNKAARELQVTEYLLAKRLKDVGETASSEGSWSTSQLVKAMFGSLHFEQLRRIKAEADGRELQNGILRSEFVPVQELTRTLSEVANAMKQIVRASDLDRVEQDDFLRSLAAIPVTIKAVASNQGRNGDSPALGKPKRRRRRAA